AILLPKTAAEVANDLITRIQECCRNKDFDRNTIPLSLSLGASTRTDIKKDINSILKEAEENMYKNKFLTTANISNNIIDSLQSALWEKSHESKDDLDRVKKLTLKLGRELKLPESELDKLSILSAIHDIGKVAVLEDILEKKVNLSEKDWRILKRHSQIGYNIAKSSNKLAPVAEAIMTHHEWWNGNGYPYNLKGEEIPIISRIFAVVDAYDAMISDRPFKKAISKDKAIEELKKLSKIQFDPSIVDFFIKIIS
ncbi:MAG: HD domain-containing protein, partial [Actinobacteria bacterium]|nr:HD domain-containing protein [Actinomycetota bacterium]